MYLQHQQKYTVTQAKIKIHCHVNIPKSYNICYKALKFTFTISARWS